MLLSTSKSIFNQGGVTINFNQSRNFPESQNERLIKHHVNCLMGDIDSISVLTIVMANTMATYDMINTIKHIEMGGVKPKEVNNIFNMLRNNEESKDIRHTIKRKLEALNAIGLIYVHGDIPHNKYWISKFGYNVFGELHKAKGIPSEYLSYLQQELAKKTEIKEAKNG